MTLSDANVKGASATPAPHTVERNAGRNKYSNQVILMGSAGREGVSHKARLAGNGVTLFKRRNTVDDRFPARLKGAPQMRPCGVAVLDKGTAIACERRLARAHLGSSELINITWLEY